VIAAAVPGLAVGRGEQRLDLLQVEVADQLAVVALGRDLDHACDRLGVFGMTQRSVAVERVDRGELLVAGAGAVAALGLEVIQECADQLSVEVGEVQVAGCLPVVSYA
jgi:hypothetical protein